MLAISERMKLVVPLTIPNTFVISVAARLSWITRITGTTPATAASKRSWTPASRAAAKSSSPCWAISCLLAVTTCLPAARAPQHVVARRVGAADQLDDDVRALEDLVEVALGAAQDAGDLRAAARDGLDRVRARARSARGRPRRPSPAPRGRCAPAQTSRPSGRRRSRAGPPPGRRRPGRRPPAAGACRCSCSPSSNRRPRSPGSRAVARAGSGEHRVADQDVARLAVHPGDRRRACRGSSPARSAISAS